MISRAKTALFSDSERTASQTEVEFDLSEILTVLSNARRRRAIAYLIANDTGNGVELGDMALALAVEEHETKTHVHQISSKERDRVRIPLYQHHLEKLDDIGIAEWDKDRCHIYARDGIATAHQISQEAAAIAGGDEA